MNRTFAFLAIMLGLVAACGGDTAGVPEAPTTTAPSTTVEGSGSTVTQAATRAPSSTTLAPSATVTIAEFGAPLVSGDELPALEDVDDGAIGLTAPEVEGTDFGGTEVSVTNDGTPKAIAFLAHWCPHCQEELPEVAQWLTETGGVEGVEIIAVATGTNPTRPNYPPSRWFVAESWPAPVIVDDDNYTMLRAFGGTAFPFWVFIDADGAVALRIAGRVDVPTLEAILVQLGDG